jgi:hypothetical protein
MAQPSKKQIFLVKCIGTIPSTITITTVPNAHNIRPTLLLNIIIGGILGRKLDILLKIMVVDT